jgi:hypothetical protein
MRSTPFSPRTAIGPAIVWPIEPSAAKKWCGGVGDAYRVTDKVNIPELQGKLQRRIDMVTETAKRLAELGAGAE